MVKRPRARTRAVPQAIASHELVAAADRVIAYELPAAHAHSMSPQHWARATWEGAPRLLRWFLVFGWNVVLRLRLEPLSSPQSVLGWRITSETADQVTLEATSRLILAHNIAVVREASVLWITLVRYKNCAANPVWRLVEPVHRAVLPYTLTRAGRACAHARRHSGLWPPYP